MGVVTHAFKLSTQKTKAGDFCEFKTGPVSHLKNKTENKTKKPLSPTKWNTPADPSVQGLDFKAILGEYKAKLYSKTLPQNTMRVGI